MEKKQQNIVREYNQERMQNFDTRGQLVKRNSLLVVVFSICNFYCFCVYVYVLLRRNK